MVKILLLNPLIDPDHEVVRVLRERGLAPLVANDADEAGQVLALHAHAVAFAIVHREGGPGRPPEEGLDLMRSLRGGEELPADFPFILTSSVWKDADCAKHQGTPEGANAYLPWPLAAPEDLVRTIEQMLGASLAAPPGAPAGSAALGGGKRLEDASRLIDLTGRFSVASSRGSGTGSVLLEPPRFGGRRVAPGAGHSEPLTASRPIRLPGATRAEITAMGAKQRPTAAFVDDERSAPPRSRPPVGPDEATRVGREEGFSTLASYALGGAGAATGRPSSPPSPPGAKPGSAPPEKVSLRDDTMLFGGGALEDAGGKTPGDAPDPESGTGSQAALDAEASSVMSYLFAEPKVAPDDANAYGSDEDDQGDDDLSLDDGDDGDGDAGPADATRVVPPPRSTPSTPARELPGPTPSYVASAFASAASPLPSSSHVAAPGFAHAVGDAVIPGGAAHSPDVETLKRYLLLREQDVAVLSTQLKVAQEQIDGLDGALKGERARSEELQHLTGEHKKRIDAFETEKAAALGTLDGEILELKFQLKSKGEKVRAMERQVRDASEEMDRLKDRVRADIRKIRVREHELENRLDILRKDSEALLATRETKLVELKRKIDLLEFNVDLLQDQNAREREKSLVLKERLQRLAQVVKVADGLLDRSGSSPGDGGAEAAPAPEAAAPPPKAAPNRRRAS